VSSISGWKSPDFTSHTNISAAPAQAKPRTNQSRCDLVGVIASPGDHFSGSLLGDSYRTGKSSHPRCLTVIGIKHILCASHLPAGFKPSADSSQTNRHSRARDNADSFHLRLFAPEITFRLSRQSRSNRLNLPSCKARFWVRPFAPGDDTRCQRHSLTSECRVRKMKRPESQASPE